MASFTPFAVGSPLAVSAPLIGSSVPILIVLLPPACGVFEHAENATSAITPSAPTLVSFIQSPPKTVVRIPAGRPRSVGPAHRPGIAPTSIRRPIRRRSDGRADGRWTGGCARDGA